MPELEPINQQNQTKCFKENPRADKMTKKFQGYTNDTLSPTPPVLCLSTRMDSHSLGHVNVSPVGDSSSQSIDLHTMMYR